MYVPATDFLGLTDDYSDDMKMEKAVVKYRLIRPDISALSLKTSKGLTEVSNNDYVIKDSNGEYSSCDPVTFDEIWKPIFDEVDDYFSNSTKEELERDWAKLKQETSHIDSTSVDEFIKDNNNKNE